MFEHRENIKLSNNLTSHVADGGKEAPHRKYQFESAIG